MQKRHVQKATRYLVFSSGVNAGRLKNRRKKLDQRWAVLFLIAKHSQRIMSSLIKAVPRQTQYVQGVAGALLSIHMPMVSHLVLKSKNFFANNILLQLYFRTHSKQGTEFVSYYEEKLIICTCKYEALAFMYDLASMELYKNIEAGIQAMMSQLTQLTNSKAAFIMYNPGGGGRFLLISCGNFKSPADKLLKF